MIPSNARYIIIVKYEIMRADFNLKKLLVILLGFMVQITASINPILHITEPTAFPVLIVVYPSFAAEIDTMASGRVVARLTIVAPISTSGSPDALAMEIADSVNQSPPLTISNKPIKNIKKAYINKSPPLRKIFYISFVLG